MPTPPNENGEDVLKLPPPDHFWAVVHARPRCEKRVVDYCRLSGFPVYLPLRKKVHRYGARERVFWSPLFPGYAFCVVSMVQRSSLRQNRYVANLLEVVDQKTLVNQLQQIRMALQAGDVLEVMPYLEKGKPVRVMGGPFKGLEGIILRIKGQTKVVINVDMIQQAVAVEVDSAYLGPA